MEIKFVAPEDCRTRRGWILKLPIRQVVGLLNLYDPDLGMRYANWVFSKTVIEICVDGEWRPFAKQPRVVHNDYGHNAYGQLVFVKGYGVVYR